MQRTRRNILENFAKSNGDKLLFYIAAKTGQPVMLLKRTGMQKIVNSKAEYAQRNFLNTVHVMFEWAVSEGRVPENPTLGAKRQKIKSKGYHTATENEIARMEATHAIGTRERLAFALLLYSGVRRTDVVAPGPGNIHGDVIMLDQHKIDGAEEAHLEIPLHPKLKAIIAATPTTGLRTFLVTKRGKPFFTGELWDLVSQDLRCRRLPRDFGTHIAQGDGAAARRDRLQCASDRVYHRTCHTEGGGALHRGGGSQAHGAQGDGEAHRGRMVNGSPCP